MKQLSSEGLADNMGQVFAERLCGVLQTAEVDLVVPIPLHWWRKWTRGYNQAEAIAREMAKRLNLRFSPKLLSRVRWTPQQVQSSREARLQNVKGAFRVRRGANIAGLTVLLVDDVMTTGSTLGEASRMLRRAGAVKVIVAILARK